MAYAPFPNKLNSQTSALNSKISSTTNTNPLQKLGQGISSYWNNTGPGRYHNPSSPDYLGKSVVSKPQSFPSVQSTNDSFMKANPQYSTTSGTIKGTVASPIAPTPKPISSTPVSTASPIATPTPINTSEKPVNSITAPSTFSSLAGSLGNQGNSTYNQATQNSITGLQGMAQQSPASTAQNTLQNFATNLSPEVVKAQKDYNDFAQSSPYMIAAQSNPNVAADIASGRSSLLGQTFGAVLGAKGQGVNNALGAQSQQISAAQGAGNLGISGQTLRQNALNEAGGLAQTGQSQAQSALTGAANLIQPRQNGYVLLDPATGQPVGGSQTGLNAAQIGGQYSAAESGGAKYGSAQQQISGAQGQVDQLSQLLGSDLTNPSNINAINEAYRRIASNVSNPNYTTLKSLVSGINNSLSQVLGQTIDVEQIASQKGQSIGQVIQNLMQQAKAQAEGYKATGGTEAPKASNGGNIWSW